MQAIFNEVIVQVLIAIVMAVVSYAVVKISAVWTTYIKARGANIKDSLLRAAFDTIVVAVEAAAKNAAETLTSADKLAMGVKLAGNYFEKYGITIDYDETVALLESALAEMKATGLIGDGETADNTVTAASVPQ